MKTSMLVLASKVTVDLFKSELLIIEQKQKYYNRRTVVSQEYTPMHSQLAFL